MTLLLAESATATWIDQLRRLVYEPLDRLRSNGYALSWVIASSQVSKPTQVNLSSLKSLFLWPRSDLEQAEYAWSNLAKAKFVFQPMSPLPEVLATGARVASYGAPEGWKATEAQAICRHTTSDATSCVNVGQVAVGRLLQTTKAFLRQVEPRKSLYLWALPVLSVFAIGAYWYQQKRES